MTTWRKFAFLAARPGMTDDEFRDYWRTRHGPLVANTPGYAHWRHSYTQNHIVENGPLGAPFAFSGIAQFDLPGELSNEQEFAGSAQYTGRIRVDEQNFIDLGRAVSMSTIDEVYRLGSGPAKLVVIASSAGLVSPEELRVRLRGRARAFLDTAPGANVRGWVADFVVPGSIRLLGASTIGSVAVDVVQELWFDSHEALHAALASPEYAASIGDRQVLIDEHTLQSFIAREYTYFANGQPTPLAAS